MYHILVPVDTDREQALSLADALAAMPFDTDAVEVTVLNVFEAFEGVEGDLQVSSADLYDESAIPESMAAIGDRLEDADIQTSLQRRHGEPAEEIVAFAHDADVDLILMGGRKRSPVGKALFGSVSQKVLLDSGRPVTVLTAD